MFKLLRLVLCLTIVTAFYFSASAQNLAINNDGSTANASAILDAKSTSKGVLIPRMSKVQKNAIATPATGLLVFQETPDSIGFHYYNGTKWVWLTDATNADTTAWKINGNSNITSARFLGTTNDSALRFKIRNVNSGILDSISANTALGYNSLPLITTGTGNTTLGYRSGVLTDTTDRSVALGFYAGEYNRTDFNVMVGQQAGRFFTFSNYYQPENTAIGAEASHGYFVGPKSTAIGYRALYNRSGSNIFGNSIGRNTVMGDSAMALTAGQSNTVMGVEALSIGSGASWNIAIGDSAMGASVNSSGNVAIGYRALTRETSGYPNTAVGYLSQDSVTTGGANTTLGTYTLSKNQVGYNNTAIGNSAMYEAKGTQLIDNTAIGNDALRLTRYYGQTALGAGTLRNDTSGLYNTALGYLSMYNHLRGNSNTAVGTSALRYDTTGNVNTAVGVNAMFNHRNGDNNVAIGVESLFNDVNGGANTSVGAYSMHNHKTNGVNTAVGFETMYFDTASSYNVAMGYRALRYTKNGFENTALGVGAIEYTDSSYYNTAVGRGAMINMGGTYNTTVGYFAAGSGTLAPTTGHYINNTTNIGAFAGYRNIGDQNTFLGYVSGYGNGADSLRGIENTGLGSYTLTYATTGKSNTAAGMGALFNLSTGSGNVGVGTRAGLNNTTGSYNVAVGDSALYNNGTGSRNIAIGNQALRNVSTSNSNIAIGDSAMALNTSSGSSIAIGTSALKKGTGYNLNIGIGTEALANNVGGYENVATGYFSMRANTNGYQNVAYGTGSMEKNLTGNLNVAVGRSALFSHQTGNYNTAVGMEALSLQDSGYYNTAVGYHALYGNKPTNATQGNYNTGVGMFSLSSNVTGNYNAAFGYNANVGATSLTNATAIGALAYVAQSNSMVLGSVSGVNTATSNTSVGIGTIVPAAPLHVANTAGTTDANAAYFISNNGTPTSSNGAVIYAQNTYNSTADVGGVIATVLNTTAGYGFGGYFRSNYTGVFAQASPGASGFASYGVNAQATGATGQANYGIFALASNGTTNYAGYFSGNVYCTGTYLPSDNMLKSDVKDFDASAVSKIMSLQPKSYNYDVAKYQGMNLPTGQQYGFIAQDLEKVFPQLVTRAVQPAQYENGDKSNKKISDEVQFKAVNYIGLIPVLTKAMQEQQVTIDKQAKENEELKKKNEQLENDVRQIKAKLGM